MQNLTLIRKDNSPVWKEAMPAHLVRNPVNPEQLNLLREVFDEACAEYRIEKDSPDAEALALILVNQLQKGADDKRRLVELAGTLAQAR
ncbi:MAG: hypothetical protein PW791_17675 [Neorhizobium sp.]|nr:hypothetical protein [Neorhizobium sp.]